MSHYMLLLVLVVSIPFAYSFENRVRYYKSWNALFKAIGLTAIPFILWDIEFTARGIWHFNDDFTGPVSLAGLPLEEWLFFIAIPFSCIYIFAWVKYFRRNKAEYFSELHSTILLVAGSALLVAAAVFHDLSYTRTVFGALGFFLLLVRYHRPNYLDSFFIAFLITKIPFFLVNGYLTGRPVVLYNNEENLGIRLVSIPVEDIFYSLLLLFMNACLYEKFLKPGPEHQ